MIKVEVEVSKESYELGQGLVALLKAVMVAKRDGWQIGVDAPAIVMAAVGQMAAIEGVEKIQDEMKADPAAFAKALGLALADAYGVVQEEKALEDAAAAAE